MKEHRFVLGYFYLDRKTGQYICKPTNISCDQIRECYQSITDKPYSANQPENYNISEFDLSNKNHIGKPVFIASCNLKTVLDDKSESLARYKI